MHARKLIDSDFDIFAVFKQQSTLLNLTHAYREKALVRDELRIMMRRQTIALPVWAKLNGVEFHGVDIERLTDHGIDKGSAVVATRDLTGKDGTEQLMLVPKDMILSLEAVANYAKSDKHLREVLEAVGDYGRVRGPSSICVAGTEGLRC